MSRSHHSSNRMNSMPPSTPALRTSSLRKRKRENDTAQKNHVATSTPPRLGTYRRKKSNRSPAATTLSKIEESRRIARDSTAISKSLLNQTKVTAITPKNCSTTVLVSPYSGTTPIRRKEGSPAFWRTKGELLCIAKKYGGLAVQYRAKYHEGRPIKDSSPMRSTTRSDKMNTDRPLIYPGTLVIQSRFVSSSGCHGGSTFSFTNFRLPGNFRRHTKHHSIYQSTRPSLTVPKQTNEYPLFVIDMKLSESDKNIVRAFVAESMPGFSPSQVVGNVKVKSENATNLTESTRTIIDEKEGNDRKIHTDKSYRYIDGYKEEKDERNLSNPMFDITPTIPENIIDSPSKVGTLSNISHSSMDNTIFVPSQPKADAKPGYSILRKRTTNQDNDNRSQTKSRITTSSSQTYLNDKQQDKNVSSNYSISQPIVTGSENGSKSLTLVGNLRNRAHLLKRKLDFQTPTPTRPFSPKTRRENYGRHNRNQHGFMGFNVETHGLYFAFIEGIEATVLNNDAKGLKTIGRVIELPGEILPGEWTVKFQTNRSTVTKLFQLNTELSYRNNLRPLPTLSDNKICLDGITISTVQTSINREETLLEQDLFDHSEVSLSPCHPFIRSLTMASFTGFDSVSDFIQRRVEVANSILDGIEKQSDISTGSVKLLPVVNEERINGNTGVSFLCRLALKTNILIHIAQDDITGQIVGLDVVVGSEKNTSDSSSDSSETRYYLSEEILEKHQKQCMHDINHTNKSNSILETLDFKSSLRKEHATRSSNSFPGKLEMNNDIQRTSENNDCREPENIFDQTNRSEASSRSRENVEVGSSYSSEEVENQSKVEQSDSHMSLGASTILHLATERSREIHHFCMDDSDDSCDLDSNRSRQRKNQDDPVQPYETISCMTEHSMDTSIEKEILSQSEGDTYDPQKSTKHITRPIENDQYGRETKENHIITIEGINKFDHSKNISNRNVSNVIAMRPHYLYANWCGSKHRERVKSVYENDTFYSCETLGHFNEMDSLHKKYHEQYIIHQENKNAKVESRYETTYKFHDVFYGFHDYGEHESTILREGEKIDLSGLPESPKIPQILSTLLKKLLNAFAHNSTILSFHDVFYGVQDEDEFESTCLLLGETMANIEWEALLVPSKCKIMSTLNNCILGPDIDDDDDDDESYSNNWNPLHDVFFGFHDENDEDACWNADDLQKLHTDRSQNWSKLSKVFAILEEFFFPEI